MSNAIRIYNMFSDLDSADYLETYEADIQFIQALLETIGERDTIATLKAMTE